MQKRVGERTNRDKVLYLMLIPCLLVLLMIVLVPLINLVSSSLLNYQLSDPLGKKFIGIENYIKSLKDANFWASLWVTTKYIVGALTLQVPVSLLMVEILFTIKHGSSIVKTLLMPTMVMPPVVAGVMWRIMFHPSSGLVNYFLSMIGLNHAWLSDTSTTLLSLVFVDFWQNTPFLIIILLAGRSAIPVDLYESAMLDGASALQVFRNVTLPLLRNSLILGILFRTIDCIKVFPTIHIMTAGGPGNITTTVNYYTYKMAFSYTDVGYSSALGFILLVITTLLSFALVFLFKKKEK